MQNKRIPAADLGRVQRQVYAQPVGLQGPQQSQFDPNQDGVLKGLQQFVEFGTTYYGHQAKLKDAADKASAHEAQQQAEKVNAVRAEAGLQAYQRSYEARLNQDPTLLTDQEKHDKVVEELRGQYFSEIDSPHVNELVDIRVSDFTASVRDAAIRKKQMEKMLTDGSNSIVATNAMYDDLLKKAPKDQHSAVFAKWREDIRAKLNVLGVTDPEQQEKLILDNMEETSKDQTRRSAVFQAFMDDTKLSEEGKLRLRKLKADDDKLTAQEQEARQSAFFPIADRHIQRGTLTYKFTNAAVREGIITADQERAMHNEQRRLLERAEDKARIAREKAEKTNTIMRMYTTPGQGHLLTAEEQRSAYLALRQQYVSKFGEQEGTAQLQRFLRSNGYQDLNIQGNAAAAVNSMTGVLSPTKEVNGSGVGKLPVAVEHFLRNTNAWELFDRGQLTANLKESDVVPLMTFMGLVRYGGKSEVDAFNIVSNKGGVSSKLNDIPVKEQGDMEKEIRKGIQSSLGDTALTYSDIPALGKSVALHARRSGLSQEAAIEIGKKTAIGMFHKSDAGKVIPYSMTGKHASVETLNRNHEAYIKATAKKYGVDPKEVSITQFGGYVMPVVNGWIRPGSIMRWDQYATEAEKTFDGKPTVTGTRRNEERQKVLNPNAK